MKTIIEAIILVFGLYFAFMTVTSVTSFLALCGLVITFLLSVLHLLLIGAHWMAILYLLIYVGAVLVIFLFLLMVTDFADEIGYDSLKYFVYIVFISAFIITILIQMLHVELGQTFAEFMNSKDNPDGDSDSAVKKVLGVSDYSIYLFSRKLYREYGLVIINAGILLLIAMLGCIKICLQDAKRIYRKHTDLESQKQKETNSATILKKDKKDDVPKL